MGITRSRVAFNLAKPNSSVSLSLIHISKQKQTIIDRKNELVENTLKNGGKVDDIKDQLKHYGKQLADLDKQIAGPVSYTHLDVYKRQVFNMA